MTIRKTAAHLALERAARRRDGPEAPPPPEGDGGPRGGRQIKRMKLMDLEFANEALKAEGETAHLTLLPLREKVARRAG